MYSELMNIFQIGTLPITFYTTVPVSEKFSGEHKKALLADKVYFTNSASSEPNTITVQGDWPSNETFSVPYIISIIREQTRKIVPVIGYIDLALAPMMAPNPYTEQNQMLSQWPLLWMETEGKISSYEITESDGKLKVNISLQMDAYWQPLNPFTWVYQAASFSKGTQLDFYYDYFMPNAAEYLEANVNAYYKLLGSVAAAQDNSIIAQSFTVTEYQQVDRVRLYLRKVGTPVGNLTVTLRASTGSNPTAVDLSTAVTVVAASSLSVTAAWVEFSFNPVYVVPGVTYWVTLTNPLGGYNAANYTELGADTSSPTYSGGFIARFNALGVWVSEVADAAFQVIPKSKLPPIVIPPSMTEYLQTNADGVVHLKNTDSYTQLAQSFQVLTSGDIQEVQLYLTEVGTIPYGVYVTLHPDTGGNPNTAIELLRSDTAISSEVPGSAGWVSFLFPTVITLQPSVTYWIVLNTSYPTSSTNYVMWSRDGSSPSYSYGVGKGYAGSWSALSVDFIFKVIPFYYRTDEENRSEFLENNINPYMYWGDVKHQETLGYIFAYRPFAQFAREWDVVYQASLWPYLVRRPVLDYPALGQYTTLNSATLPDAAVWVPGELFPAPPLSYYRLTLNQMSTADTVTIEINNGRGEIESYTFAFDDIEDALIAQGYTGVSDGDYLIFGDVHLMPCFIISKNDLLTNVYIPMSYNGQFPGQLTSGQNTIHLTSTATVTMEVMHLFRRNT